ncbi:MAG: 50S ribosomal protein L21 [Buchnera aphidicola (Meitanaphis flavogallis)]
MYAIFINGGKQYKVTKGQVIKVEKLNQSIGDNIKFEKILMISDKNEVIIGKPLLLDSFISANVIKHGRNKKINIIKFNRRKHHKKSQGHRQHFTEILITNIYKH